MRCPYCRGKMEKGFLQSSKQIFWSDKGHDLFGQAKAEDIVVAEKKAFGSKKESWYCEKCGILITEMKDKKGLFR